MEASKSQKPGAPYISDDENSDKWAWVLFEAEADIPQNTEIVAKAVRHTFVFSMKSQYLSLYISCNVSACFFL